MNRIFNIHIYFLLEWSKKQKITWELSIIPSNKPILKTDQKHLPFEELFFQKTNTHTQKQKQTKPFLQKTLMLPGDPWCAHRTKD